MAIEAGSTTYWQSKRGIVQDGLVLNLDAGVDASYGGSGTTWTDLKGGNNGTLINGPTFDSANGGSIVFDGTNDYIASSNAASSIRGGSEFTIGFWVKKTASNKDAAIGAWYHSSRSGFFIEWYSDNYIYMGNSSGGYNNNTAFFSWTNNWHYFSGVYDGSASTNAEKGKIYANGNLLSLNSTGLNTTSVSTYAVDFTIGKLTNYSLYTNAKISIVQLYNRALSADEVLQNYNATRHRFGV